jgi:hypothetical protein
LPKQRYDPGNEDPPNNGERDSEPHDLPLTFAVRFPRALIFVDCHMLRSPFGFAQIVLSVGNPAGV